MPPWPPLDPNAPAVEPATGPAPSPAPLDEDGIEDVPPAEVARHRPNLAPVLGRLLSLATSIAVALADGKITAREGQRLARRALSVAAELAELFDRDE